MFLHHRKFDPRSCFLFRHASYSAWVPPKDLSKLKKHEIEAYINEPHKKSGDLLTGYRIALNPEDWEKEMEKRREEAEEAEEAQEEQEVDEMLLSISTPSSILSRLAGESSVVHDPWTWLTAA